MKSSLKTITKHCNEVPCMAYRMQYFINHNSTYRTKCDIINTIEYCLTDAMTNKKQYYILHICFLVKTNTIIKKQEKISQNLLHYKPNTTQVCMMWW